MIAAARFSRDFHRLHVGRSVSTAGSALTLVALPLALLERGGPGALGGVLAATAIAQACGYLPGGWLADRWGPRTVMVVADLTQAVTSLGLAATLFLTGVPIGLVAAFAAAGGLAAGVFQPAGMSIMPRIVAPTDLPRANAVYFGTLLTIGIVVPMLAGLALLAVPVVLLLALDALSFLGSAAAVLTISRVPAAARRSAAAPLPLRVFRSVPALLPMLLSGLCGGLVLPAVTEVFVPVLAQEVLGVGGPGLGTLLAAQAAGSLLGTVFAGRLGTPAATGWRSRPGLVAIGALLTNGLWVGLLGVVPGWAAAPGLALGALCLFGAGLAMGTGNVLLMSIMQVIVPGPVLGRVVSVVMLCNVGTAPLSLLLGTGALAAWGPGPSLFVAGAAITVSVALALVSRHVRELRLEPAHVKNG